MRAGSYCSAWYEDERWQAYTETRKVLTEYRVVFVHHKDSQAVEHVAPEMLCSIHPWRFSSYEWISPEQPSLVSYVTAFSRGWIRDSPSSLPTWIILWFCDSVLFYLTLIGPMKFRWPCWVLLWLLFSIFSAFLTICLHTDTLSLSVCSISWI